MEGKKPPLYLCEWSWGGAGGKLSVPGSQYPREAFNYLDCRRRKSQKFQAMNFCSLLHGAMDDIRTESVSHTHTYTHTEAQIMRLWCEHPIMIMALLISSPWLKLDNCINNSSSCILQCFKSCVWIAVWSANLSHIHSFAKLKLIFQSDPPPDRQVILSEHLHQTTNDCMMLYLDFDILLTYSPLPQILAIQHGGN